MGVSVEKQIYGLKNKLILCVNCGEKRGGEHSVHSEQHQRQQRFTFPSCLADKNNQSIVNR